jgi:hypothetical protein
MSNRFYVNGVQIFGNNEMFDCTYEELKRQGGNWEDDGYLPKMEITDPQALIEAVTKDSLEYLKNWLTKKKKFEDLTDVDLLLNNMFPKELISCCYKEDGTVNTRAYGYIEGYLQEKRIFTPFCLYMAIKDCVERKNGKLVLKEGKKIIAEMY